jgi:hypothetical protein
MTRMLKSETKAKEALCAVFVDIVRGYRHGGVRVSAKLPIDPRSLDLYAFDAHSHVSRDAASTAGNLRSASAVMKREGFHFFFAGSPYDNATHLEDLDGAHGNDEPYRTRFAADIQAVCDESFILDIGNELVKGRYGHAFMFNHIQRPPFSRYYDHAFDRWMFARRGDEPPYDLFYPHQALMKERTGNSVAAAAHPTSWWWGENGAFVTNIAATLGFELLAGSIDAMVIMGYDRDHVSYQDLWNDALSNGYFLPGIAETDTLFDSVPQKHLAFKTYTYCDRFDVDALCDNIKAGRNIVSTGPLLLMTVNGEGPGAVLPHDPREPKRIAVRGIACLEAPLSAVQIIVNGKVRKTFDLHEREFDGEMEVRLDGEGYIYAKCYDCAGNTAITNPVYVRNTPFLNKGFKAKGELRVGGEPAKGTYWTGDGSEGRLPFEKTITLEIDPSKDIHIQTCYGIKTVSLFELPELQAVFKNLYLGGFNAEKQFSPGEVPAEDFRLKKIREVLGAFDSVCKKGDVICNSY